MTVSVNSIVTPQNPKSGFGALSTANTTFSTAPTNSVLIATAGANGARLVRLEFIPLETVTANALQWYRSIDAGTTKYLAGMATGGSDTVSGTDGSTTVSAGYSDDNPLTLQPNERIYAATGITKGYHVVAEWADY